MTPVIDDLNHAEMHVRYATMQDYIEAGSEVVAALSDALAPGIEEIRWRAAATLAWIGDPAAIPAMERASIGAGFATILACVHDEDSAGKGDL